MSISLTSFAPENLVSRDRFGSPVPRQPAHLHTQAEFGAYLRDSSRFPRRHPYIYLNCQTTPSVQSRVYRLITQLRIDGVYCRESAGIGPVNAIQSSSKRMLPWQVTMDQLKCASSPPHYYWYEVGMLIVPRHWCKVAIVSQTYH